MYDFHGAWRKKLVPWDINFISSSQEPFICICFVMAPSFLGRATTPLMVEFRKKGGTSDVKWGLSGDVGHPLKDCAM